MSAEKGKMTPEDLAGLIYEKIIQENSVIYKDIYVDGYKNGATDPYMRKAFDFVSRLSESDRQTLLLMMRQVMVDTSSSLLAMFDGGADISPHTGRFEITYDDGRNLCGDLQVSSATGSMKRRSKSPLFQCKPEHFLGNSHLNKPLDDAILHIIKTESCSQGRERLLLELQRDFVKGESLGLFLHRELGDYCKERNPGVELIIDLGLLLDVFDDNKNLIDVLARLIDQDWHFAHEDIVSALEMIGGDDTLSALEGAARSRPHYLARVDGAAALTRKAIWAIWKVQTLRALRLLEKLSHDEDCTISALAKKQLRRKMNFDGEGSSADETQA